jgi:hypothetical protein
MLTFQVPTFPCADMNVIKGLMNKRAIFTMQIHFPESIKRGLPILISTLSFINILELIKFLTRMPIFLLQCFTFSARFAEP